MINATELRPGVTFEYDGNLYVCLDYRKSKEKPSICVWSHEESEDFAPVTYKVADTFSEFVEMLG